MTVTIGHSGSSAITIDPARLVQTRMLIQANSGGGKSWMLRVLCERVGRTVPLIVLDWEGEFASLREKLDVLLVGREGEIPTAIATAGALATQILEIGVSAVVDLYDLSLAERRVYVRRFLESLMAAPKRLWSPRLVIVDEAHMLCPEGGHAESGDAVRSLASAGRKRDFCAILATQRLSKLSKDAAAETNNKLIGRCTLDVDQNRALDELGMPRNDRALLRDLGEGEFFAFGPALNFQGVRKLKSVEVTTTHGHRKGAAAKPPEPSARMRGVVDQLKDLAERAKTEVFDLDAARATIADLRRQLAKVPAAAPAVDAAAVERAVALRDQHWRREVDRLRGEAHALAAQPDALRVVAQKIERAVVALDLPIADPEVKNEAVVRLIKDSLGHFKNGSPGMRASRVPVAATIETPVPEGELGPRHRRVLDAVLLCHSMGYERPTREQVSFWCGLRGGNFKNLLGALRSAGQVEYPEDGTVRAVYIGGTVPAAHEAYKAAMASLEPRLREVLEIVLKAGSPITREALSERCGKSGGNFKNLLGALRTAGLITYPSSGVVDAASWLLMVQGIA